MRLVSLSLVLAAGCGATASTVRSPVDEEVVEMEELRIVARPSEDGFDLESYDAETLFHRALGLLNSGQCRDAVALYDRLADEFPSSRYRSAGLYNAGYCLQDTGEAEEAILRYERLLSEGGEPRDEQHARFQLAKLYIEAERFEEAVRVADELLEITDLSSDERMEAMARRAQGLLGTESVDEAREGARSAILYYRTRSEDDRVNDEFFAAAANFVLAETIRLESASIPIPVAAVEVQREVLERRAQLLLNAQQEYFNTISLTNAHWAAAAGYRIGAMYDDFWHAIMNAPAPPPREPLAGELLEVYLNEYRLRLAQMVKPLIRNAIRYWELTLMMVERTGVQTEWANQIEEDLERARERLLEQPSDVPPSESDPEARGPSLDEDSLLSGVAGAVSRIGFRRMPSDPLQARSAVAERGVRSF
ncbi:MAG: tetratricopeptide repeat protein [Myxococcota bacterium]